MFDENPITKEANELIFKTFDPTWDIDFIAAFVHENDVDIHHDDMGHLVTSFDKHGFDAPTNHHHIVIGFWKGRSDIAGVVGYVVDGDVAKHYFIVTNKEHRRIGVASVIEKECRLRWKLQGVKKVTTFIRSDNTASIARAEHDGWRLVGEGTHDTGRYELAYDEQSDAWG